MQNLIDYLKQYKKEAILTFVLLVFSFLAMFDFFNQSAMNYIEESFNFALGNIALLAVLKIVSGALPLTGGIGDILDKVFNFFFIANLLIGIEYILLIINKILFIKILIIFFFALRFFPQFRVFSTKILVILLFFNPGLNIYINAIKIIANEANMTIDKDLNLKMENIKRTLGITPPPNLHYEELGDTRSAVSKIIGNIGIFGQNIENSAKGLSDTITNPVDSANAALDNAKIKILKSMQIIGDSLSVVLSLSVKYILNVFFLFFLMPIVYFYVLYRLVGRKEAIVIQNPNKQNKSLESI